MTSRPNKDADTCKTSVGLHGTATALSRHGHGDGGTVQSEHPASYKRRRSLDIGIDNSQGALKRVRLLPGTSLCSDKSLVCPEIWHRVFTFCPPKTLGRLLTVNKLFNLYLDPASPVNRDMPASVKPERVLKPNAIWQASRRLFWPQMPTPLRSKTELEMWRLACSHRCQHCGKLDERSAAARPPDSRSPGPGRDGVAAIWAFGARFCGSCLLENTLEVGYQPSN